MLTPQDVACNFIPAFFERLATNPADLADMYSRNSSLVLVDFEYGTSEVSGVHVPKAVEDWSQIVQGCEMSVESYSAAQVYGGVSVYATVSAESNSTRHYFQFVTLLEEYEAVAYHQKLFYIRHQIIIRPGAMEKEQAVVEVTPAAAPENKIEEPTPQPAAEEPAAVPEKPETPEKKPQPQKEQKPTKHTPAAAAAPEVKEEEKPQEAAAVEEEKAAVAPTTTAAPAAQKAPARPTSWASLASKAPKGEQRQPLKVVFHENGAKPEVTEAPVKPEPQPRTQNAVKPPPKAPRAPAVPVGDRLMFNIDHAVSDEDIKTALGPMAAHIVSLRNNSASGYVFLDFAENEKVLDVLKANPPTVGARKTRVNVYRQRTRQ